MTASGPASRTYDASAGWALIPLGDRAAWDSALESLPHGIAHTWGYNAAMQASGGDPIALMHIRTESSQFACPIAERSYRGSLDAYTPLGFGGFVGHGDVDVLVRGWRACAERRSYVTGYVGLHPMLAPLGLGDLPDAHHSQSVYVLDLRVGAATLLAGMSASVRRRLRRASEEALPVETDRAVVAAAFEDLYAPFMTARGAAPAYQLRDRTLRGLCDLPGVSIVGAPAGDVRAVVMTGSAGWGVDYLFGVSRLDARAAILPLLWEGMRRHAAAGAPWLNLGGGIRGSDTLAEFKRRLGGKLHPHVSLATVFQAARFRELSSGLAEGGFFPPYHAPGLPSSDEAER